MHEPMSIPLAELLCERELLLMLKARPHTDRRVKGALELLIQRNELAIEIRTEADRRAREVQVPPVVALAYRDLVRGSIAAEPPGPPAQSEGYQDWVRQAILSGHLPGPMHGQQPLPRNEQHHFRARLKEQFAQGPLRPIENHDVVDMEFLPGPPAAPVQKVVKNGEEFMFGALPEGSICDTCRLTPRRGYGAVTSEVCFCQSCFERRG